MKNIIKSYLGIVGRNVQQVRLDRHMNPSLTVNSDRMRALFSILKKNSNFRFLSLMDLGALDLMELKTHGYAIPSRFELYYVLLGSIRLTVRIFLKQTGSCPSLTMVFKSIGWLEREVYDLFGIVFIENTDLRRILTDYGFENFPLRKDFPLGGYYDLVYNEELKQISRIPVCTDQEQREFFYALNWKKN